MESAIKIKKVQIGGMTCINCQNKLEKKLRNTAGIQKAEVSYSKGTALVSYDTDIISFGDICKVIKRLDYIVLSDQEQKPFNATRGIGLLLITVVLYLLLDRLGLLNLLAPSRLADTKMGYGLLFVIGLVTSVHCVAMCGGINLSQCIPYRENLVEQGRLAALRPAFLYNLGRVASYTAVGFLVGALGSAITFSNTAQGLLKLAAGVFMLIMGVNMLGLFPWLRRLTPRMPAAFARRTDNRKSHSKSPLIVGMLNGLMPCGPLQAMQIYALSTASPIKGAFSMLLFSLGTVPLMFSLGALSSVLGKRFTKRVMTIGAVLVVVLGLSMLSQGWSLAGFFSSGQNPTASSNNAIVDSLRQNGTQVVSSTLSARQYPTITVQAGTPVKWLIDAPQGSINGCNNRMIINEYGVEHTFTYGENVIEFTPENTGFFRYSCWMGMIRGTIHVVEAGTEVELPQKVTDPAPANVTIPTDRLAVAELLSEGGFEYQTVTIKLSDSGYSPAIVVVQGGMDVQWNINNTSSPGPNTTLLVPDYSTVLDLESGKNTVSLFPAQSFAFSNGNSKFYGYVKVVEDIGTVDTDAVKKEAAEFQTMIYPTNIFQPAGGGSCCAGNGNE